MIQSEFSRQIGRWPADPEADDPRSQALREILARGRVRVRYQPIFHFESGEVYGSEALSSVDAGTAFAGSHGLFAFAETSRHILELERLCRRQAFVQAAILPPVGRLFLNCSACAFDDPELLPDLLRGAAFLGLEPRDVVLELTERVPVTDWPGFLATLAETRRAGFAFAVDDFGAGHASLLLVLATRPDVVKLDRAWLAGLRAEPAAEETLAAVLACVRGTGAAIVAEGIERPGDLAAARRLGLELGQGYLLGYPSA